MSNKQRKVYVLDKYILLLQSKTLKGFKESEEYSEQFKCFRAKSVKHLKHFEGFRAEFSFQK